MLPILFQNHNLILYSYPLLMGIGWGIAHQIYFHFYPPVFRLFHGRLLFWGAFIFSWIGAKFLFLITSAPPGYDVLSFFLGGGFVFYGGFIGVVLYISFFHFFFSKISICQVWPMLPALVFGHMVGRIGCFLAGCCFGAETDSWFSVHIHGAQRYPVQLIEALGLLILGILLIRIKSKKWLSLSYYLLGYGSLRFVIELFRGDQIRGQWFGFTPGQWVSLGLFITGLIIFIFKNSDLDKLEEN